MRCGPCTEWPTTFADLKPQSPTSGTYWADPFIVERGGVRFLFVEEYDLRNKQGHIAVARLGANGLPEAATTIVSEPHHLSYPFVFEYENTTYLLPESSADGDISLYRCLDFPYQWQHQQTLMRDIRAVDSTLFAYGDRWWLFTCISAHPQAPARDELFLYYADTPLSDDWTPHPLNPIVADARCARPAGGLFVRAGHIYRPAQDCSRRYGYGLRIMEIMRLDTEGYMEREEKVYLPQGECTGMHTFNQQAGWTAVDVKVRQRREFLDFLARR